VATVPNVLGRKLGLAGTACVLLVLTALTPSAFASGPTWLAPVSLSATGQDAQTPVVTMNNVGMSEAVWTRSDGTNPILQTSFRLNGPGDTFEEQDVSPDSSAASAPDVSEDQTGDAEAVWLENGTVMWSWRTNDVDGFGTPGATIGTTASPDACAGNESDPKVAVDPNGDVIAVWLCDNGGIEDVEAAYAAGGTAGTFNTFNTPPDNPDNLAPVQLSDGTSSASNPQIAEDPNGDATVVWQESNGTYQQIQYAYRPNGNSSTFNTTQTVSAEGGDQTRPAVTMDGNGNASAAWVYNDGTNEILQEADATSAILASTSAFGSPTSLTSDGADASDPQIADDSNGDTAVVWALSGEVQASFRPSGGSFGTTTTLGSIDPAYGPQIAITSAGDPIALWQYDASIQAETATSGGTWQGAPTQLSNPADQAIDPTLAVDGQGDAIAGFLQNNGANEIAMASGYDPGAGPANTNLHIAANGSAGNGLTFYTQPYDVWPAITSVSWNFGDGTSTQSGDNTVHTFAQQGNYTVSVTSTDADGNQTTSTQNIDVAAIAPTVPVGGIAQLPAPNDCVTSEAVGCGTLIPYGLNIAYEPVVSPDGKFVYGVSEFGGITEFSRNPSTGSLTEIGCVTAAPSGCSDTGSFDFVAGLNNPAALAISPDGTSAYAVGQGDNAIVAFIRNTTSGLLTPQTNGCYSSDTPGPPPSGCTSDPGLGLSYGVVVSQDGKNVYASGDAGHDVAEFTRNANGTITPIAGNDCISDGTEPTCQQQGANGLLNAIGITAIGGDVYVTAGGTIGNGDIAEFTRNPSTGALASDNPCIGSSAAPSQCDQTAAPAINGTEDMAISPNGKFAYANSSNDDALVELSRNTTTGALSQIGCVETSNGPPGLCSTSDADGIDTPLGVAISPDGTNLYVSGAGDNAEAAFSVNSTTGLITQLAAPFNCITSNSSGCGENDATGLDGSRRVAVSPDGKNVYVAGQGGPAIVELARTPVPAATPPPASTPSTEASYDSNNTASTITATITVPAVSCSANPRGTYAGQGAGLKLYGNETIAGQTVYPAESAEVRTYCDGKTAVYTPEFVVNDVTNGTIVFHRAGITVSPGDPLEFAISATSGGAKMQITDVNTKRSASITGPGFTASDGPDIGITSLRGNGHGAPMITGAESAASPSATIPGPVPSSPVVFQDVEVDGQPLSKLAGLYTASWTNTSNQTLASVSPVSDSNEFTVKGSSVSPPGLAKSADVAPVSGKVLIELPGTHKFVPLTSVKKIPDGTLINAINGSVQITVELPNGTTQTGVFFGGEFRLEQAKNGQTTAVLAGGSFKVCPKPPSAHKKKKSKKHGPLAQTARVSKKHPVRSLWSNAHGSFSTKGRYGAAAVRGTEWLTRDQCDGTYFKVTRDEVQVTSFDLHNHKTLVKQGHSFLSPAPGYK
jgi:PKD domain/Lactonase, 7-bladed beta-propeller